MMNTKRTLLINMFDSEHHNPYMYSTGLDFLRSYSDREIIDHLPKHLEKVNLSQYTDHGAKSYLQMLYVIFQDIQSTLLAARENDLNNFEAVFQQYFQFTNEFDDLNIQHVFEAAAGKIGETAYKVLSMEDQPYKIVLDKVLENVDEINECFVLYNRSVVDLERMFKYRIQAVS